MLWTVAVVLEPLPQHREEEVELPTWLLPRADVLALEAYP